MNNGPTSIPERDEQELVIIWTRDSLTVDCTIPWLWRALTMRFSSKSTDIRRYISKGKEVGGILTLPPTLFNPKTLKITMKRDLTPEQRAIVSERMRALHARRKPSGAVSNVVGNSSARFSTNA